MAEKVENMTDERGSGLQNERMDKQTLFAVLQFLKKNNLKEMLDTVVGGLGKKNKRKRGGSVHREPRRRETRSATYAQGIPGTESLLRKEANLGEEYVTVKTEPKESADVSHALAAYKSDDDPSLYEDYYSNLKDFVESCLDVHKVELHTIMYPVFVHMYLELTFNKHAEHARIFFDKFSVDQEEYYRNDLIILSSLTSPEQMASSLLMESFKSSKFVMRMSRDSYNHLKRHLQEKRITPLLDIIQDHLFVDVYDGIPRSKEQITASSGGILGEASREANKVKIYYGLLKEPELNIAIEEEEETETSEDKPKKKKAKRDLQMMKKSKTDPHAPGVNRVPLPELRDLDKLEKVAAYKESLKCVKVAADALPSILFYGVYNASQGVTSVDICENSTLMATGFADSNIKVWSLTPDKLQGMKSATDLELIDKDSDYVIERMMDEQTASMSWALSGHRGPVYSTSFSHDRSLMLSASEDGTIRLWSLKTWTPLVIVKGHNYPVWDVQFSPHGHYFISGGHDRTARLWATEYHLPMRIFSGHLSDVDSVCYHPNSNYVATGSSDRTVRVWDVLNGDCVRFLTGHKGAVHSLCFSPDGKYLTSAGTDGLVILWDLANGTMVSQMKGHVGTVYSMCYSRDSNILATGGIDHSVKLWDVRKVLDEQETDIDVAIPSSLHVYADTYDSAVYIHTQQTGHTISMDDVAILNEIGNMIVALKKPSMNA